MKVMVSKRTLKTAELQCRIKRFFLVGGRNRYQLSRSSEPFVKYSQNMGTDGRRIWYEQYTLRSRRMHKNIQYHLLSSWVWLGGGEWLELTDGFNLSFSVACSVVKTLFVTSWSRWNTNQLYSKAHKNVVKIIKSLTL